MRAPLILTLLAGCVLSADAKRPDKSPAPPAPSETIIAMHRKLSLVDALRAAVIEADVEAAKSASRSLAALPPISEAPDAWRPWLGRVRHTAAQMDDDWTLDAAARTVAELGRTCGGCHGELNGGPHYGGDGSPPPEDPGKIGHMQHHQAAVEGMWQGLVMDDTLHFARAAKALGDADPGAAKTDLGPLDARLHTLSAKAARAKSLPRRADLFGSVLATCAECHASRPAVETP